MKNNDVLQYAIFDMDGTLIDSMPLWKDLAKEYLISIGVKNVSQEILDNIAPMTLTEICTYFVESFKLEKSVETVIKEMKEIITYHYQYDIPIKKGAKERVFELNKKNVKMCVCSSTSHELIEVCLERLGIKDYFEFILSCEEVGVGKEKPNVYFEAIKRLGAKVENTMVFEDSFLAMQTAKKAGFYVYGIIDEAEKAPLEEIQKVADEVVNFY